MMKEKDVFPDSFHAYCRQHPEKFVNRIKLSTRMWGILFLAIGVFCIACPSLVPLLRYWLSPGWIRGLAVIPILIGVYNLFINTVWYNKQSGGLVKKIGIRKFDRVYVNVKEITDAFEKGDVDYLAEAKYTLNDPLQLHVYEDRKGQEFYCQLRLYNTPSEYSPISDVRTFSGSDYQLYKSCFHSMKSEVTDES